MNEENKNVIKLWMPVIKNPNKPEEYLAILSDTSLDRDNEGMSKELLMSWAKNKGLPALADHKNSMGKWIGGWKNLKAIETKGRTALFAEPWFFTKDANPLAAQIKKQVDEAITQGLNPGISVGFIAEESEMKKIHGEERRIYTKGELLESTWVPIQSNRNASFGHVAKNFDIKSYYQKEETKMKEFEQKDIDSAVEKAKTDLTKELDKQKVEVTSLTKSLNDSKEECTSLKNKVLDTQKLVDETKVELKKAKDSALEKQQFIDEQKSGTVNLEEFDTKTKSGKLPIMQV